jgi:hypothetical protein
MATEKQIKANQSNAQKAGVKTEEGKAIVRYNAFKHGLSAKALLSRLPDIQEAEAEYLEIVAGFRASFQPKNFFEESMIEQMARAQFKFSRYDRLEADQFELNTPFDFFESERSDQPRLELKLRIERVLAYKTALENQFFRALAGLIRTRQAALQLDLFSKPEKNLCE